MIIYLFTIFVSNILPIFLIAGVGFILQIYQNPNPRDLSQIVFYVFLPALVFTLFITTEIPLSGIFRMMAFATVVMLLVGILSGLIGKIFQLEPSLLSALIISSTFMNSGNFGLSVCQFAYGNEGLAWASLFYVTSSTLNNSVGVFLASLGKSSFKSAIIGLTKIPMIYMMLIALTIRIFRIETPPFLLKSIDILGRAAVPTMLLLLGMQMARSKTFPHKPILIIAITLRLIFSSIIAWLIAPLMGLNGLARQIGILESGMPTAVLNLVITQKYNLEPEFVSKTILISTLFSSVTLSMLLALVSL